MVWNSIPVQLAKENKKFFFGQIREGARAKDFEIAIEWLLDCGLIKKVCRVNKPAIPLKAYMDFSAFKLFLLDIGLLGTLTEQYVLQQLVSDTDYTPYYYAPAKSTYEINFMVQKGKEVVPVEVKAEINLRAKSMKTYCEKYRPEYAVRASMADYKEQGELTNIPLYAVCNI